MTNIYGDGYEAATEPGPDVEFLNVFYGKWILRRSQENPLSSGEKYRRPIKLRVGETYRGRNGVIVEVVELNYLRARAYPYKASIIKDGYNFTSLTGFATYKENGAHTLTESPLDIIEHIPKQPKEKPMNEHEVGFNGMTKREVIAKDALTGLLANRTQVTVSATVSDVVGWSIKYADEMIKQLVETEAE